MKSLTTYEKICLGCVIILVCVLGFYLGKAAYKWSVKEPPQIGSSVQAYSAEIKPMTEEEISKLKWKVVK